jgi:YbbR domain-containing protein
MEFNMGRMISSLVACFAFLLVASTVYAHPPSDIQITFDPAKKMLSAVIVHNTSNPERHYINKVNVGLNGNKILEQDISRQDNGVDQTVSYLIPDAKDGDVLSVEGACNMSGKLQREITVKTN